MVSACCDWKLGRCSTFIHKTLLHCPMFKQKSSVKAQLHVPSPIPALIRDEYYFASILEIAPIMQAGTSVLGLIENNIYFMYVYSSECASLVVRCFCKMATTRLCIHIQLCTECAVIHRNNLWWKFCDNNKCDGHNSHHTWAIPCWRGTSARTVVASQSYSTVLCWII